jgi:hypothetical protein
VADAGDGHPELPPIEPFNQETAEGDPEPERGPIRRALGYALWIPLILLAPLCLVVFLVYLFIQGLPKRLGAAGASLNRTAGYRDGFFLLIGASYVLGYAVWALHAWRVNLGLLPALRFQYIFAGLVPLTLLWLLAAIVAGIRRIQGTVLLSFAAVLVFVVAAGLSFFVFPAYAGTRFAVAYVVLTVGIFVTGALFGGIGMLGTAVPWMGFTVFVVGSAFYALVVYPRIPQALGGVEPQCAYLDLRRDALGSQAMQQLGAVGVGDVVRSGRLSILFTGTDFLLVEKEGTSTVHRIGTDAVADTITCG